MFVSVKINKWLSNDQSLPDYWRYEYTLVDDEFGSVTGAGAGAGAYAGAGASVGAGAPAIIIEYSKRKLNVEGNLLKYLMFLQTEYDWKIDKALAWYNKACKDKRFAEFAALWKTVDQKRLLKLATFS